MKESDEFVGFLFLDQKVVGDKETGVEEKVDERVAIDENEDSAHSGCGSGGHFQVVQGWDEESMAGVEESDKQSRDQT